jgi:hypothetical protein
MIAATIRYVLPEGTDWEATRKLLQERAQLYVGMPGLHSKAFFVDPETREYGGYYVWNDRASLDAFLASDIVRGAISRFGQPKIEIREVAAHLEGDRLLVFDQTD